MSKTEKFDAPDADIILRTTGPPKRDFRVHSLLLSLASPVFKDMFSLPQPTTPASGGNVAETEIVEVTDPARALDIVLRLIYPFTPPSFGEDLDILVECLVIADKYEIKGAMARLRRGLSQVGVSHCLRVYAIASRFGFANIAEATSLLILSSVNLAEISQLPDDFKFVSAAAYHRLVRRRTNYLEEVVEVIKQTPLKSSCSSCPGGRRLAEEIFRLRLSHLIMSGTPVEAPACFEAWVEAYGLSSGCEDDCVVKFIRAAFFIVGKQLAPPGPTPPQRKSILKNT